MTVLPSLPSLSLPSAKVKVERYYHNGGIEFRFFANHNHKAVSAFRLDLDGYWDIVDKEHNVLYFGYDDQAAADAIKNFLAI